MCACRLWLSFRLGSEQCISELFWSDAGIKHCRYCLSNLDPILLEKLENIEQWNANDNQHWKTMDEFMNKQIWRRSSTTKPLYTLLLGGMDSTQKVNIDQNCWIRIRIETKAAEAQHCSNLSLIYLHGNIISTERITTSNSESVADPHHFDAGSEYLFSL